MTCFSSPRRPRRADTASGGSASSWRRASSPNQGDEGRPRIRWGDLPLKPSAGRDATSGRFAQYDPRENAKDLFRRMEIR